MEFNFAQVVQDNKGKIKIFLVKNYDFSDTTLPELEIELRKRLGNSIIIDFHFVEDVKPSAGGKRRLVINNIKE